MGQVKGRGLLLHPAFCIGRVRRESITDARGYLPLAGAGNNSMGGMLMYDLEVVYLSPQELTPYENNTRRHSPDDIDGIIKSIEDTGFNDPIGIWGDKNLIVEGHGRQLAAIQMGLDKVPCIRLDHLTEEQRKEYAIRHNRSAEM